MTVSVRRERVFPGDNQLSHLAMTATDAWILRAELLKKVFPFLLAPMFHQADEPFRLLPFERHLSFPFRIEQIFVSPRRFAARHHARIVRANDHRQTAGDPKTLRLQKALIVLLHRRSVISLQRALAPR